ncbi:transcriptional regulator [Nocardiopsis sp. CNR-923]|uniref:helix-turn-helix domain-containing protein n=1 Tax=Nocardiopsis sp. CNR-923 TaxID=1904965 RepID=UPI00095D1D54|nr:helix-turn-helix transcriptional regulator [Nocardiopsis sp. CNR-923]OLT30651.1 transcriptional regulator [Nocardiopsis sp. CNR-923]
MSPGAALAPQPGVGPLLRSWRNRRRISQLHLSIKAEISTRHLSSVETGRSRPSREMVLRLSESLDVPLRDRNRLLLAAGYAPVYAQTPVDGPDMEALRGTVRQVLAGHEPFPTVVVDRVWTLLEANGGIAVLLEGVAGELLEPPVNVLRVGLHPRGLAPRIVNFGQWRAHLLDRLRREAEWTADPGLRDLYRELRDYPCADSGPSLGEAAAASALAVPLRLRHGREELALLSTVATFGTPVDVTVSELRIESFLPADRATARALRAAVSALTDADAP